MRQTLYRTLPVVPWMVLAYISFYGKRTPNSSCNHIKLFLSTLPEWIRASWKVQLPASPRIPKQRSSRSECDPIFLFTPINWSRISNWTLTSRKRWKTSSAHTYTSAKKASWQQCIRLVTIVCTMKFVARTQVCNTCMGIRKLWKPRATSPPDRTLVLLPDASVGCLRNLFMQILACI